jgi:hypothetical protein
MKRIPRRLFTEEFKREAIKLVTEQLSVGAHNLRVYYLRLWLACLYVPRH